MKLVTKKNNKVNDELHEVFNAFCEGNAGLQSKLKKQKKLYTKLNIALSNAVQKDKSVSSDNIAILQALSAFDKILSDTRSNMSNFSHLIKAKERAVKQDAKTISMDEIIKQGANS
jgi:hypothetical protein